MVNTPATPSAAERYLSSRVHVIPGEDPAEFDALVRDYRQQFNPDGPVEGWFFETLVLCDWKKRRLARWEAQVLRTSKPFENGKESPVLKLLTSQLRYNDRTYFSAYRELRRLQQERRKAAPTDSKPTIKPEAKPQPAKAAPANAAAQSPQTGGIGFVSQKADAPAPILQIDLTGRKYNPDLVFVG